MADRDETLFTAGPGHWREAELIALGERCEYGCPHTGCEHEMAQLARAQVHASLAATAFAATAESIRLGTLPPPALEGWRDVLELKPGEKEHGHA